MLLIGHIGLAEVFSAPAVPETYLVRLTRFKRAMEYLGGAQDEFAGRLPGLANWPFWGLWWAVLALLIYIFCGQSSKFIYIDF